MLIPTLEESFNAQLRACLYAASESMGFDYEEALRAARVPLAKKKAPKKKAKKAPKLSAEEKAAAKEARAAAKEAKLECKRLVSITKKLGEKFSGYSIIAGSTSEFLKTEMTRLQTEKKNSAAAAKKAATEIKKIQELTEKLAEFNFTTTGDETSEYLKNILGDCRKEQKSIKSKRETLKKLGGKAGSNVSLDEITELIKTQRNLNKDAKQVDKIRKELLDNFQIETEETVLANLKKLRKDAKKNKKKAEKAAAQAVEVLEMPTPLETAEDESDTEEVVETLAFAHTSVEECLSSEDEDSDTEDEDSD